jgi:hypothetical protein
LRLLLPAAAAVAVALSLTGSAAWAAPPNACRLVTPAEVGALVGASVAQGPSVSGPNSSTCDWKQTGATRNGTVEVIVATKSAEMFEAGKRIGTVVPVAGVGDEAYQTTYGKTYTVLSARKGANAVTVTVRGLKDAAAIQAAEKAVTKAVVARL